MGCLLLGNVALLFISDNKDIQAMFQRKKITTSYVYIIVLKTMAKDKEAPPHYLWHESENKTNLQL